MFKDSVHHGSHPPALFPGPSWGDHLSEGHQAKVQTPQVHGDLFGLLHQAPSSANQNAEMRLTIWWFWWLGNSIRSSNWLPIE